ncbi:MAG: alpha/beta hydrolase [Nitrospira sp. BO4]|jgi:hypothetical protein|nr:alpha/beta hydrolase [Nitrospira sp. BO4]
MVNWPAPLLLLGFLVVCMLIGCSHAPQYTSKDLTILPCEQRAHEFFFPLEFDAQGSLVYEDQPHHIAEAMPEAESIYVFVHGWNKVPKLAETDYQDLICRFYTHSKANKKKSIVIGLFWPSTEFPPLFNFWSMKGRADTLAITGFQDLMRILASGAKANPGRHYDLAIIGHSFGGRIVLNGISQFTAEITPDIRNFFSGLNQFQIVLITAAMSEYNLLKSSMWGVGPYYDSLRARWRSDAFYDQLRTQVQRSFSAHDILVDPAALRVAWHPSLVQLSSIVDLRIYNIFSSNDQANKIFYPIGSLFEDGGRTCGIGACGVTQWPKTVSATYSGSLKTTVDLSESNLWNVDASDIISSHTDIYKGRVANLLWELIALPAALDPEIRKVYLPGGLGIGLHSYYKWQGQQNLYDMQEMNRLRQTRLTVRNLGNESVAIAHRLDDQLSRGDWVSAETSIRLLEISGNPYPAWFVHFGLGLVHEGNLFRSSQVFYEWYPLGRFSLKVLLGVVLSHQGRCKDAEEALNASTLLIYTAHMSSWVWWDYPIVQKLADHNLALPNCYFRKFHEGTN